MNEGFHFNEAVKELLAGKKISGKDGILAPLVKQLVEAALEAEVWNRILRMKCLKAIRTAGTAFKKRSPINRNPSCLSLSSSGTNSSRSNSIFFPFNSITMIPFSSHHSRFGIYRNYFTLPSLTQANEVVGDNLLKSLFQMCGTKIVLQYSEPYGQKVLSQFLGEQEIDRKKQGINRASQIGQDRLNESEEEKIKKNCVGE